MKRLFTKSFLLTVTVALTANISLGQNWAFFPLNQVNYYTQTAFNQSNYVESIIIDSSKTLTNGNKILYFNQKPHVVSTGNCFSQISEQMYYSSWISNMTLDSLVQKNDTVFYNWQWSASPFYFITSAQIGQSWTVISDYIQNDYDEIVITCTNLGVDSFFGMTDSVKYFSLHSIGDSWDYGQVPIDSFEIILSKSYGLISFVPMLHFLFHPHYNQFAQYDMVGLKSDTIAVGFSPPAFSDYFHLHAGDVLMWTHIIDPDWIMYPTEISYYKDSIFQSIITPDSVVYFYNRLTLHDSVYTNQYNQASRFYRHQFQNIIEAPSNALGFGNNQYGSAFDTNDVFIWTTQGWYTDQPAVARDFYNEYWFVDTFDCDVNQYFDVSNTFSVNTLLGVTSYCSNNFDTDCTYIIGYKVDGVEYGNLNFPSAINELVDKKISLGPNPASRVISVTLPYLENNLVLYVRDYAGRTITRQKIAKPQFSIDVSQFENGIYFFQLMKNETILYNGKFAVMH